ncbi:hypothetical protein DLE54_08510 [Psychrobacter sp. YP14]|nr:hypothetical protein DLE54_08510 [Psychrobacter sp. YP14]
MYELIFNARNKHKAEIIQLIFISDFKGEFYRVYGKLGGLFDAHRLQYCRKLPHKGLLLK